MSKMSPLGSIGLIPYGVIVSHSLLLVHIYICPVMVSKSIYGSPFPFSSHSLFSAAVWSKWNSGSWILKWVRIWRQWECGIAFLYYLFPKCIFYECDRFQLTWQSWTFLSSLPLPFWKGWEWEKQNCRYICRHHVWQRLCRCICFPLAYQPPESYQVFGGEGCLYRAPGNMLCLFLK